MIEYKMLGHGYLKLISHMGSDLEIVNSARLSYDGKGSSKDEALINYLLKNGHNTPFESCEAAFEVKAPIFVVRQWHRHRTQSYNEISARYAVLPDEYYVPEATEITTQSKDNKQMRTKEIHPDASSIQIIIDSQCHAAYSTYQLLLDSGCPRELARGVLPVNMFTKFRAKANLNNWFRFLKERLHPHAQYEIRIYAEAILKNLQIHFPVATKAFREHGMKHEH